MKRIALVLGTARKERESEKVFRYLTGLFEAADGVELTTVDVRDHITAPETVPPWGTGGTKEQSTPWQEIATAADIFVFVLPEYNHGYPGEWKLLMDTLYKEYEGKHAYIAGVSSGAFAGVRVADHVKPVLVELKLIPHKTALYVGNVEDAFKDDGEPADEKLCERAQKFVTNVIEGSA